MKEIFPTKAVILIVSAAVVTGLAMYFVRERTLDKLTEENQSLRQQLRQAQSDRQAALAKANAREVELERLRPDSLELARLRAFLKTNSPSPTLPTGFYVGTDQPIYVTYGTSDPVLRSLIRTMMNDNSDPMAKGEAVFQKICAACHQPDGRGKDGVAPPLVGSEWVLAPGGQRLVRIVLNGLSGPITVQGRVWNLPMPPWRENLDDDAIAVVLNYVRTGLGTNKAAAIKSELVGAARQELHPGTETSAELLEVPVQ